MKKMTDTISESKSQFFVKTNKLDNPLVQLVKTRSWWKKGGPELTESEIRKETLQQTPEKFNILQGTILNPALN